jgi:8-hydroxy-5-deazaflavin:NADPH oxidoreductase
MKNMLFSIIAAAAVLAVPGHAASPAPAPLKIGIIGTGSIGGALATHWAKAGHEVFISSRHPEKLQELAKSLGPRAHVGTPQEAAAFGEVVLISVPYAATPQVGRDYAKELKGKVVLDTGNPYPQRDGEMAVDARRRGTGVTSAEFLPGVRLVRAFNAINAGSLRRGETKNGERVAIPLASDDKQALEVASRLVRDAGFEPVVVGPLSRAKEFDYGTSVYTRLLTAKELRKELNLTE